MKLEKAGALAVIAYHNDSFDNARVCTLRHQYYHPGTPLSTPTAIFDGTLEKQSGPVGGTMYQQYAPLYDIASAVAPTVDISMSLESSNTVRIEVYNAAAQPLSGTLHIVVVERHRPYQWKDMEVVDFLARAMLPTVEGQAVALASGARAAASQKFTVMPDWNYCSIVAFVQAKDKRILQGAILPLDSTVPRIQVSGEPKTGMLWAQGSNHDINWSSDRPLGTVQLEFSADGGKSWSILQSAGSKSGTFSWTVPQLRSSQCLLAVRDPYGGAQAVSGMFAVGLKGDLNGDGVIDAADRKILVDCLLENKAILVPGMDLNEDGATDILDLIYLDSLIRTNSGRLGAGSAQLLSAERR